MNRTSALGQVCLPTLLPSPEHPLRLRLRFASGKKKTLRLFGAKLTIGNTPECGLRISAKGETGVLCTLLRGRNKVVVRSWSDCCTLNSRKFEITSLSPGDALRVGGCDIRIADTRKKRRPAGKKSSKPERGLLGKELVDAIGKRLGSLEHRLLSRQRKLARQMAKRKGEVKPQTEPTAALIPPPVVIEGLSVLQSTVEELRQRVENVASRPWPASEPAPTIDTDALLNTVSTKIGAAIETGLREHRTQTAAQFERISRDFDQIGNRLTAVEQKFNLPQTDSLAEVTQKIEQLAKELDEERKQAFPRSGAKTLLQRIEALSQGQSTVQSQVSKLGDHFTTLHDDWSAYRSGVAEELKALASQFSAAPEIAAPAVDLTPLQGGISVLEERIAKQNQEITALFDLQREMSEGIGGSMQSIAAVQATLENLEGRIGEAEGNSLSESAVREIVRAEAKEAQSAQADLLKQILSLEERCLTLEGELARLAEVSETQAAAASQTAPLAGLEKYFREPSGAPNEETNRIASAKESAEETLQSLEPADGEEIAPSIPASEPPQESLVERLKRSGLWNEDLEADSEPSGELTIQEEGLVEEEPPAPQPAIEEESFDGSADDPRDVVGSSFHTSSAPPHGFGSKPLVEVAKHSHSGGHSGHADGEDESIDSYMERLLRRVAPAGELSGGASQGQSSSADASTNSLANRGGGDRRREDRRKKDDQNYAPRGEAPEKSADISALRELAMTSANMNIQTYRASTKAKAANEKGLVVIVAMMCAMASLYLFLEYRNPFTFLAAIAAFCTAIFWAIQASVSSVAAHRIKKRSEEESNDRQRSAIENASSSESPPANESAAPAMTAEEEPEHLAAEASKEESDAAFQQTMADLLPGRKIPR